MKTDLQNLPAQSSDSSWLVRATTICLSLFAITTLISQSAMDLFSGLFALGALALMVTRPDYRAWVWRRTGFEWVAALWFLATALSLVLGAHLVESPQWTKLLDFRWLILAVLAGRHLGYIRARENQVLAHWIAFSAASLWAIAIFFLGYDPLHPGQPMDAFADGTVRTGGFLQQAIVFAQLYGLWLVIPIGILARELPQFRGLRAHPVRAAILLDAILWGSLAILLSFTRGIWLAVPLATLVLLLIRRWTWAAMMTGLGGAGVVTLMQLWPALNDRVLQAFQGGDSERLWIWKANLQMWMERPLFGVGYNHNVQLLPEFYRQIGAPEGLLVSHAHNEYLQILVGTGVAGLLAYAAFWGMALYRGFRCYRRNRESSEASGFALGITGAICVFLFGGAFESNFEHAKIRLTLALVMALLIWLEDRAYAVGEGPKK